MVPSKISFSGHLQSYQNDLGVQISYLQSWGAIERLLFCKCSWTTLYSFLPLFGVNFRTLGFSIIFGVLPFILERIFIEVDVIVSFQYDFHC